MFESDQRIVITIGLVKSQKKISDYFYLFLFCDYI